MADLRCDDCLRVKSLCQKHISQWVCCPQALQQLTMAPTLLALPRSHLLNLLLRHLPQQLPVDLWSPMTLMPQLRLVPPTPQAVGLLVTQ